MTDSTSNRSLNLAGNEPDNILTLSSKRTMSLIDENSPLLPASSSKSNPLRRHDSLPNGPFETPIAEQDGKKIKLRKTGTFSTYMTDSIGKYAHFVGHYSFICCLCPLRKKRFSELDELVEVTA